MNWLHRIAQQPTVLWHATTANLAEEITNAGKIIPSSELGSNYVGWGLEQKGQQYGEGVYLAKTAEDALYYASIRLRGEWDSIESADDYDLDENFGFLGLFRVFILDTKNLVPVNSKFQVKSVDTSSELMYLGQISSQPGSSAWFDGPKWVSRNRDLEKHQTRFHEVNDEIPPVEESDQTL